MNVVTFLTTYILTTAFSELDILLEGEEVAKLMT